MAIKIFVTFINDIKASPELQYYFTKRDRYSITKWDSFPGGNQGNSWWGCAAQFSKS